MSSRSYYQVHVSTSDLQIKSIFVGPGPEATNFDETAAARLVEANLEKLTGEADGHIMPVFARPSTQPPDVVKPTTINGIDFYVMPPGGGP